MSRDQACSNNFGCTLARTRSSFVSVCGGISPYSLH